MIRKGYILSCVLILLLSVQITFATGKEDPYLNVSVARIDFSKVAGCQDISVNTNQSFTISSNRSWCLVTAFNNEKYFKVSVSGNSSGARTATLTLSSPGVPDVFIQVLQEGAGTGNINLSLVSYRKIWDEAKHNAFTDLIKHEGQYYCVFREGVTHAPTNEGDENGRIRILKSANGETWTSQALLEKTSCDLRDPKLSITPDGRLMVLMGGSVKYIGGFPQSIGSQVSFMDEAGNFSPVQSVNIDPAIRTGRDWLWRVTWYKGTGYGVVFHKFEQPDYKIFLVKTTDGIDYQTISQLQLTDQPNEATISITDDNMCIVVRREVGDCQGKIGYCNYPFMTWNWHDLGFRLGGPNLITLPDGNMLLASRGYRSGNYTALFGLDSNYQAVKLLEFPSGGTDTGYPGVIIVNDELWVSYYSSHEGKASIYLAKVKF